MNVGNLSDWVLGIIALVVGWIAHVVTSAFALGKREADLVRRKDLERYVTRTEFSDLKLDIKNDLDEIKERQGATEELNEKRHSQIIDILINGGGRK